MGLEALIINKKGVNEDFIQLFIMLSSEFLSRFLLRFLLCFFLKLSYEGKVSDVLKDWIEFQAQNAQVPKFDACIVEESKSDDSQWKQKIFE